MNSLLGNFGLIEVAAVMGTEFTTQNDALTLNALSTLGPTGWLLNGETNEVRGILEDIRFPDASNQGQWASRLIYHGSPRTISYTYLHYDSYRDSVAYPDIGHIWVQDAVAPLPVPVPAAMPLFVSALGAFGFFNWRPRRPTEN
ncbi:MAG: hypothetical protein ABW076_10305 [Candidatus Thiodiazotropha sp.]